MEGMREAGLNSNNVGDPRIAMEEEERKVRMECTADCINYSSIQTTVATFYPPAMEVLRVKQFIDTSPSTQREEGSVVRLKPVFFPFVENGELLIPLDLFSL